MYAPTDASPPVSRPSAHGLGSMWFAIPCIVRDSHSVFLAGFSGASERITIGTAITLASDIAFKSIDQRIRRSDAAM